MHQYLQDTEYAIRGLFALIGDEEAQCEVVRRKVEQAQKERLHAQAILHAGPPPSSFGEGTAPYFEKKVRDARRTIQALESDLIQLEASLAAKAFSVRAIAGAILQVAKQGIVVAHGSLANAPLGRAIGSETLKNVIWQARNQALHWEDGQFGAPVVNCFANLASTFGAKFQLSGTPAANLAKDVLDVLGWTSHHKYTADMTTIVF